MAKYLFGFLHASILLGTLILALTVSKDFYVAFVSITILTIVIWFFSLISEVMGN